MPFSSRLYASLWPKVFQLKSQTLSSASVATIQSIPRQEILSKFNSQPQMAARDYSSNSKPNFLVTKENKLLTVMYNKPEIYNATTLEMYNEIRRILSDAAEDDSVSLVKFIGAGKYFSSGNDLRAFASAATTDFMQTAKDAAVDLERLVAGYIDFPKPLIAAVNGPALGISVSALGLFDAVYASDAATFQMPFTKIGQSPEGCSSYTFPKIMGFSKASSMLLFGETVSAAEAEKLSLVTKVFPASTFQIDVDREVEKMLQLPVKSLIYAKRLMRDPERELLHKVNKAECERLIERWTSEDCLNAVMKFLTKSSKL